PGRKWLGPNHAKRMKTNLTRREFIRGHLTAALAAATLPSIIPASVLGQNGAVAPSNRIQIGCIGVGPPDRAELGGCPGQPDARVVALCDVAKPNLDAAHAQMQQKYQDDGCKTCNAFEELLERKDIDAVLIATPDLWHVPIALAAARAGKD